MAKVRPSWLLAILAAGLWIAPAASVHADAFAQSILVIDNFRLLSSAGTVYQLEHFAALAGNHSGRAGASLDQRSSSADSGPLPLSGPGMADVARQFVGLPVAPGAENQMSPFLLGSLVPGSFGYADQQLAGLSTGMLLGQGGNRAATQAVASLKRDGAAAGQASLDHISSFHFTLGIGDSMHIAFNATPFAQAYLSAAAGGDGDALARMSWSVDIMNVNTGQLVFAFQPGELNSMGDVSRSDSFAGMISYNPGTLAFQAQTPYLYAGENYQMTIRQSTLANAYQNSVMVPEPGGLALFGLALLGMALCARRRHAARSRGPSS